MRTYAQIREQLKTGDLVLFSGRSGFSNSIKWFTASRWSQVGMVLRHPDFDGPLVWEALRLGVVPDVFEGRVIDGVQTLSLCERVERCGDTMAVRLLNQPVTPSMVEALLGFHGEVAGRPYEQRMMELVKAVWDGPWGENTEDLSSLFCSELVAEAYQRMGLLPCNERHGGPASNEYTPAYFCSTGRLPLLGEYALGTEIVIRP